MTITGRQVVSHAASAAAGAIVVVVIVVLLQLALPPGGAPASVDCPAGSDFSRAFDGGPQDGWRACVAFLPGGTEFSLWNVTANWDQQNGSAIAFVYHFNVDVPYEAFLHQNISYIEAHEPVEFWNNTQASATPGSSGDTVRFTLFIPSLLYSGGDLRDVKEVRLYLAEHEPPVYDPTNEPHRIVSDILSLTFRPPVT